MPDVVLHGYFRSSASYRVRIALNLKGVVYADSIHHLARGEQHDPAYLALNPQGLVPSLEIDGAVIGQSLAICEYLNERFPEPPLLPADPMDRARVRAFAQVIACDVHPVQNLKILNRLRGLGVAKEAVNDWAVTTIDEGLDACERLIADRHGLYCFGDQVSLADIFLVPQLANARRFGVALRWPRLAAIEGNCLALPAFDHASPANQPDAA